MLELEHYSEKPIAALYSRRAGTMWNNKPCGLWASPIDAQDTWKDFCLAENVRCGLQHRYRLLVREDTLLHIATLHEFDAFCEEYARSEYGVHSIRWSSLAETYSGILISPRRWELMGEVKKAWYSTWDCACACIWDVERAVVAWEFLGIENWYEQAKQQSA